MPHRSTLADLLGLSSAPIAISFTDAPPAGVPRVGATEPASCGYWRRAAEGERFYTTADDHKGCPIGAHTHHVATTPAEQEELMQLVGTMVDLSYISMEDVPKIPRRETELRFAVYEPLADDASGADVVPDVVLVRGNARQLMLLAEASQLAGVEGSLAPMGRPTCAVLPAAINSGRTAASFGCVGNRVYTGAPEEEAYFAFPGEHLPQLVDSLRTIVAANDTLLDFHRQRAQAARSLRLPG
ncbi:MAG TPA: DUF169 domain-containing protein [Longimicrobiales bacterium]|nr:DUF169 domain-containing protein [Longimicrobiales bacterium]